MIKIRSAAALMVCALSMTACMTADDDGMSDSMSMAANGSVKVGGADMFANRNIVENAVNSPIHTTLVSAVQAAGLAETLSGPGPFTVFAPTNDAFSKLPAGLVQSAMRPENKAMLTSVLTYHVVSGRLSAADLMERIRSGGGTASLTTVNGGALTARMSGGKIVLTDGRGGRATVTQADVFQSNGVIHVTNAVSLPAA